MRTTRTTIGVALVLVALVLGYRSLHGHVAPPRFRTEPVAVGEVLKRVAATGTLEALKTVEVGSQVSGTIAALGADFNSIVHKGQVLARLDPSLLDAQVLSARSALGKAKADADGARVALEDAKVKRDQAQSLHDRHLIADSDFETADVAVRTAQAALSSNLSQVRQAQAAVNQALVDREHTVIAAPIDGIVIARNVDVGQTVAASYQAPTLFVLAADLTRMQLDATIDESDVGAVAPGQAVTFTVDAYPQEQFRGVVSRVRLEPVTVQNVVTYTTEIAVRNDDLRLKPGMTATLNVEVARADNVLRVPANALRYAPQRDIFARLGQPLPKDLAAVTARRKGGMGYVWTFDGSTLRPERVKIGLSDGSYAEVVAGDLREGQSVVTGEVVASAGAMAATPLMPGFGRR